MPGLVCHNVVQHLRLLNRVRQRAEHLRVPALVEPVNVILADKIEIVLVLRHHKVVVVQIVNKLVKHKMQPELLAVDKHKPRIEKVVARNTHDLLNVSAVLVYLHHYLLVTRAQVSVLYVGQINLAYISPDDRVAVDVHSLAVIREHLCDKQSVIRRL